MTIQKSKLSGSTDGLQILVAGTNTGTADTIHTATSSTTNDYDEIWLYASNSSSSQVLLTIEWGGTSDPGNIYEITLPALGNTSTDGPIAIIPGFVLQNSLVVKAFAGTTNVVTINGYVHQIRVA